MACGCRNIHPAPRKFPRCTKHPNPHLSCHEYDPPTERLYRCGRDNVNHQIEQVRPTSSTVRNGNCPNHRQEGVWYQDGKEFQKPKTGGKDILGPRRANAVVK